MEAELVFRSKRIGCADESIIDFYYVVGISGAVSFSVLDLPDRIKSSGGFMSFPMGSDVGVHSIREREYATRMECQLIHGATHCWYDGSSLRAMQWVKQGLHLPENQESLRHLLAIEYHDAFAPATPDSNIIEGETVR